MASGIGGEVGRAAPAGTKKDTDKNKTFDLVKMPMAARKVCTLLS
jgi:hypothetical protein